MKDYMVLEDGQQTARCYHPEDVLKSGEGLDRRYDNLPFDITSFPLYPIRVQSDHCNKMAIVLLGVCPVCGKLFVSIMREEE